MKTNVIQLEAHDDVVSIRDKMAWQSCQRMILVWPKRGKLLRDAIDLSLIKRSAVALGSDLALVTHHPVIQENAIVVGVPVFSSIPAAEKGDWKQSNPISLEKKFPKGSAELTRSREAVGRKITDNVAGLGTRIISLILGVTSLIALAIFIFPSATITLYPELTTQSLDISIQASPDFSGVTPSGNIQVTRNNVDVSGELSRPGSGFTEIPIDKASGKVLFTNLTDHLVTVSSGSILYYISIENEMLEFVLLEDVTLLGNSQIMVEGVVEALRPGLEGNLRSGSVIAILGPTATHVSTSIEEDFRGGESLKTTTPTDADYLVLKTQLLKNLEKQAYDLFQSKLNDDESLIDPTLEIEEILLEEKVNPPGEPADTANLRMTVRFKIDAFSQEDLGAIAKLVLDSNLPTGMTASEGRIHIETVEDYSLSADGFTQWTIRASRLIMPSWPGDQIAEKIAGRRKVEIEPLISGVIPQMKPAEISGIARWWPWMPFLSSRFRFEIGSDA